MKIEKTYPCIHTKGDTLVVRDSYFPSYAPGQAFLRIKNAAASSVILSRDDILDLIGTLQGIVGVKS